MRRPKKKLETRKVVNSNGRWEYTGRDIDGYGVIVFSGVQYFVHVLRCMVKYKRKRKDDEVTRHLCNNKICFNPDHLEFGSSSENAIDAIENGSKSAKLTHEKVREIRNSSDDRKELAKKYNVGATAICNVLNGKTWKYIK